MTDANHDALTYQFGIHGVTYEERTDPDSGVTFYVVKDDMPAALVEQVGACGFGLISPRAHPREDPRCIVAPDAAVGGDA